MAGKRNADTELTHDNWDQEQEDEEAGVFRSASKEVLVKREIKKAKRRGVTEDKGGAGAFKGFSFGVTVTTAENSFAMQPSSTTSESTSRPTFGSFNVASVAVSSTASAPISVAVMKSGSLSGGLDTESQYRHSLRNLNESVLRWIDDHIKTNPYCILTPVFNDYEKYIKELDRDLPQSSDKIAEKTTAATGFSFGAHTTVPSSGLFGSVTAAANSEPKVLAPPTSTTAVTTGFSAPGLIFGGPISTVSTGFCLTSTGTTSFAAQPSKVATLPASGFSGGTEPSKEPATSLASKQASPPTAGFSFGAPSPSNQATSSLVFGANSGFGATSGFSFGASPSNQATSGFSFGALPSKNPDTSKDAKSLMSGFSFGAAHSAQSTEAASIPASPFRFNFQASKEAASSSAPADASTSAPNEGGDDDNYVPPKTEVVDIQEEGAFYTVRCKLYWKINNEYKDRGVGNLYLKPCGSKTQLLVRAGTTLGNILLNIMLNKTIPITRQGNNVTMMCVPNPPLDEKKPDDKTAVCMLLRVKTEKEAETLLKQINDHKV